MVSLHSYLLITIEITSILLKNPGIIPQMKQLNTKECSHCKLILPKTKDYFFTKITKKGTNRLINDSISFRHICKQCHTINTNKKRILKRCEKLGIETYDKKYSMSINKLQYKESYYMDKNERIRYSRFKKSNMSKKEYNIYLSNYNKISIEKARNKKLELLSKRLQLSEISRCLAANRMSIKTKDLNDNTYMLYNKHIKFYRNVKNIKNNRSNG